MDVSDANDAEGGDTKTPLRLGELQIVKDIIAQDGRSLRY